MILIITLALPSSLFMGAASATINSMNITSFGAITYSSPTPIFSSGFENGLNGWSGSTGAATVVSDVKHNGANSLRCKSTFNFVYEDLSDINQLRLDFYVRFDAILDKPGEEIIFGALMQKPWTWCCAVGLTNVGGTVRWTFVNGGSFKFSNILTNPSTNTWYHIELKVKCGSSNNGEIQVFVDNVELNDLTLKNTSTSYASISRASIGMIYCNGWSSSDSIWVDDITISKTLATTSYPQSSTPTLTPTITSSQTPTTALTPTPTIVDGTTNLIKSPQGRYYTSSAVPIQLSSGSSASLTWNIYNGTHWLYASNQVYTSATSIYLGNGEYKLYVWANYGNSQIEETVIFGVNLRNTGAVYATGCSNTEIQAAVNSASQGYAVYLPAGTYNFESDSSWNTVNMPVGISLFGAPALRNASGYVNEWQTIINFGTFTPSSTNSVVYRWFNYLGSSNYLTRITGIKFVGYHETHSGFNGKSNLFFINYPSSGEFRIDHCYFRNICGEILTNYAYGNRGCIDHNLMINTNIERLALGANPFHDNTALYALNLAGDNVMNAHNYENYGKYTPTSWYVEDNYVDGWITTACTNNAAHVVVRNNVCRNLSYGVAYNHSNEINGHGGQSLEIYNNDAERTGFFSTYFASCGNNGVLVFNNTARGFGDAADPLNDWKALVVLRSSYGPQFHNLQKIHDVYIWGNILSGGTDIVDVQANAQGNPAPVENVDFFLRAPSLAQDGWAYKPYTYPHPLVE